MGTHAGLLAGAPSLLPAAAVLVPIAGAIVVYLVGALRREAAGPMSVAVLAATFGLCAWTAGLVLGGRGSVALHTAAGHFLAMYVDALGAVMMLLVALLGVLAGLFSGPAMPRLAARGHGAPERLPMYHALLTLFVGTMLWACGTNNIVVLWIAVEATTLASAFLVAFYWDRRSLEAGYKYLLLLTVGITFGLLGCVLLYSAASAQLGQRSHFQAMMLTEIARLAPDMARASPSVVLAAVAALLIGFGTKAGIVPMHAWLPDAHSEAPAAVSALLSGLVIKVGVYALIRCALPFTALVPALPVVLLILAVAGMLGGIAACAAQDDIKRLLAYSSISQIGYVVMGLAIGTPLGIFGGLFHLLNHALAKALLFFTAGAVEDATGERSISRMGGLARRLPYTATAFFIGALALGGLPGLNGFLSKLTIFLAAADRNLWWACFAAIITGLATMVVLVQAGVRIFMGNDTAFQEATEPPGAMMVALVVLGLLCVLIGSWPPLANSVLAPATSAVAAAIASPQQASALALAAR